jgi:REP element-mobilizing transposase RayT
VAAVLFEAAAFRHCSGRWYVHLLLLMPDHLHALITFPREENMKKVVTNFKEITAKQAGIAWQRDFFDHRLRTKDSFQDKTWYILTNPVRKGLIKNSEHWPYVWRPGQLNGGPSGPALPCR